MKAFLKKAHKIKKAYVLLSVILTVSLVAFLISFSLTLSSYVPVFVRDSFLALQARILLDEELAKALLYEAKKQGKECLSEASFNYNQNKIKLSYIYPIASCKDNKITNINKDANLSQDGVILVNMSLLRPAAAVNDEIFVSKNFYIYTNKIFWEGLELFQKNDGEK